MAQAIYLVPFHIVVILNYVLFLWYKDSIKDKLNELYPDRAEFGGSWKYLTHWNVALQLIYFCLALLNDLFGTESRTKEEASHFQKLRDFLFSTLAFPIGIFVPIIFWILFKLDRDLVFPPDLDEVFPPITNHMMHTTPLPSQILELAIVYHSYPAKKYGFPTIITFSLSYVGWIFYIPYAGGPWVYGVFEVLSQSQRLVFAIGMSLFSVLLYLIGEWCHNMVWKPTVSDEIQLKSLSNGDSFKGQANKNKRRYKDKKT